MPILLVGDFFHTHHYPLCSLHTWGHGSHSHGKSGDFSLVSLRVVFFFFNFNINLSYLSSKVTTFADAVTLGVNDRKRLFPYQSLSCHMPNRVVDVTVINISWVVLEDPGWEEKLDNLARHRSNQELKQVPLIVSKSRTQPPLSSSASSCRTVETDQIKLRRWKEVMTAKPLKPC